MRRAADGRLSEGCIASQNRRRLRAWYSAAELAEIELVALDIRRPSSRWHRSRRLLQQFRGEIHQAVVIRVGLVELQHGELGIVVRGNAFVAEVAIDFVDALQPAHDQPLQIQLRRDAQVQIDIERVVMRDERPRRRAAIERLHHGRFHFDEAARFELAAQRRDDAARGSRRPLRTSGLAIRSR